MIEKKGRSLYQLPVYGDLPDEVSTRVGLDDNVAGGPVEGDSNVGVRRKREHPITTRAFGVGGDAVQVSFHEAGRWTLHLFVYFIL